LKKPTKKEFETIAKVSALGILALGIIGFFNFNNYENVHKVKLFKCKILSNIVF